MQLLNFLRFRGSGNEAADPKKIAVPFGSKGQATYFNNTASSYHWGCYGTSMAIYEGLLNAGYSVISFDVETTHYGLGTAPESASSASIEAFGRQLAEVNPMAWRAIADSDLVVINGEGTIHRFSQGPRALVCLAQLAVSLGKRVHLINFSFFPSGGHEPAPSHVEDFYKACFQGLERVVVREQLSSQNLDRLGVPHVLGFDCLPLFLDRYPDYPVMPKATVVCGANWWEPDRAEKFAENLQAAGINRDGPVVFLSGGFKRSPGEDRVHYENMKPIIPELELVEAPSLPAWMGWLASAEVVITGRFHHFVAAAAVSAPLVYSSGNTPKTDALVEMVGAPQTIDLKGEGAADMRKAIAAPFRTSKDKISWLRGLAAENLKFG